MRPPADVLRERVAQSTEDWALTNLSDERQEGLLEGLLDEIDGNMDNSSEELDSYPELTEEQAEQQLASLDAWAALMSSAVARVYAPASPWPRRKAGWAQSMVRKLRRMAIRLQALLLPVARALKAVNFSISVGFPWGVSNGLAF